MDFSRFHVPGVVHAWCLAQNLLAMKDSKAWLVEFHAKGEAMQPVI